MQYENLINKLLDLGIEEDINTGDITTESIIPESMNAVATMTAKQDGVISGLDIVRMVYDRFQDDVVFTPYYKDGDSVKKGDVIAVATTGAYNFSMSSNYNKICRPAIVMISPKGKDYVAVERETLADLARNDR